VWSRPELLPQSDGGFVRADHDVELNADVSLLLGELDRMFAKQFSDPPAMAVGIDHVAAIRDMAAQVDLVGFDDVGPNDRAMVLRNEGVHVAGEPVFR